MANPRSPPQSDFVEDLLFALKKRSKALKHKNARPEVTRFLEEIDEEQVERVEINFRRLSQQTLILTVWGDRMVHIQAFEPNPDKGWKFQYDLFGRALGETNGKTLVVAIEE
ncbi:MAG: hypothetical protein HRT64_11260, partial [Erythrobacter sp.]|nr:hypothetical protein [Erythrobacter sp.]